VTAQTVAVVTGAGRGIGRAIAARLAASGARVVIAERDGSGEQAAAALRERGAEAICVLTDVSDPEQVGVLVERTRSDLGEIDVLVNNAAVSLGESFLETSLETWSRTIAVNLTGPFLCAQAVARAMVGAGTRGRIVNVASINSFAAERRAASYVASKGGIAMLTKAMAVDLAGHGIRVNAVAPGPIRTEATAALFDAEPYRSAIVQGVPLGRSGDAAEVAAAVHFLASEEASFVTGETLVVDGGFIAYLRMD
jgi:3-oxoacyl-[acyl-carrier protein] reductase